MQYRKKGTCMYCEKKIAVYLLFAFFFLKAYNMHAQDNFFERFEKRKNNAVAALSRFQNQDTARVNALVNIFFKAPYLKEEVEVKPYCEEALAISRKINYAKGLAECYRFIGSFYKSSMDRSNAHLYFDSVIEVTRDSEDAAMIGLKAQAQRWKGMIYYD